LVPLGSAISNLSICYRQFRLLKLTVDYEPAVATSVSGSIALAYQPDSALANVSSGQAVLGSQGARQIAIGLPSRLGRFAIDNDWKWIQDSTVVPATAANERQTAAGALLLSAISGGYPANTSVGYIRMSGVIQFRGLGRTVGTLDNLTRQHRLLAGPSVADVDSVEDAVALEAFPEDAYAGQPVGPAPPAVRPSPSGRFTLLRA